MAKPSIVRSASVQPPEGWSSYEWDRHHAKLASLWAYDRDFYAKLTVEANAAMHDFLAESLQLNDTIPSQEVLSHSLVVAERVFSDKDGRPHSEKVLFVAFRGTSNLQNIYSDLAGWNDLQAQGRCHAGFAALSSRFQLNFVQQLLFRQANLSASHLKDLADQGGNSDDKAHGGLPAASKATVGASEVGAEHTPLLRSTAAKPASATQIGSVNVPAMQGLTLTKRAGDVDRVVFCGHSLGAAVAALVFAKALKTHPPKAPAVLDNSTTMERPVYSMVGFGTPMFCDARFAGFVNSIYFGLSGVSIDRHLLPMVHFVHEQDKVPRNLLLLGQKVVGTLADAAAAALNGAIGLVFGTPGAVIAAPVTSLLANYLKQSAMSIKEYAPFGTFYSISEGRSETEGPRLHRYQSDETTFQEALRVVDAPTSAETLTTALKYHSMVHYSELIDSVLGSCAPSQSDHLGNTTAGRPLAPADLILHRGIPAVTASVSTCESRQPGVYLSLQGERLDMMYLPLALWPATRGVLHETQAFAIRSVSDVTTTAELCDFQLVMDPAPTLVKLSATKPNHKPNLTLLSNVQFTYQGLYKYRSWSIVDNVAKTVEVGPEFTTTLRNERTSVLLRLGCLSQSFVCRLFALLTLTPDINNDGKVAVPTLSSEQQRQLRQCLMDLVESMQCLRKNMKTDVELWWTSPKEGTEEDKVLKQLALLDGYLFKKGEASHVFAKPADVPIPPREVVDKVLYDLTITHSQQALSQMPVILGKMLLLAQAVTVAYGAQPRLSFLPTAKSVAAGAVMVLLGAGGIAGIVVAAVLSAPILALLAAIGGGSAAAAGALAGARQIDINTRNVPFQLGPRSTLENMQTISKTLVSILVLLNDGKRTQEKVADQLPEGSDLLLHYLLEKMIRDELFPNKTWDRDVLQNKAKWKELVDKPLDRLHLYDSSKQTLSHVLRSSLVLLELRELMSRDYIIGVIGDANTGKSTLIQMLLEVAYGKKKPTVLHIGEGNGKHTSASAFCLPPTLLKGYNQGFNATQVVVCEVGGNTEDSGGDGQRDLTRLQWILNVADCLIITINCAALDVPKSMQDPQSVIPPTTNVMIMLNRCDTVATQEGLEACMQFSESVRSHRSLERNNSAIPVVMTSLASADGTNGLYLNRTQSLDTVMEWIAKQMEQA